MQTLQKRLTKKIEDLETELDAFRAFVQKHLTTQNHVTIETNNSDLESVFPDIQPIKKSTTDLATKDQEEPTQYKLMQEFQHLQITTKKQIEGLIKLLESINENKEHSPEITISFIVENLHETLKNAPSKDATTKEKIQFAKMVTSSLAHVRTYNHKVHHRAKKGDKIQKFY